MIDQLAKQQACQLFIEQEIEKGLAEGKSKYSIGKEISLLIAKFFEAEVKPATIEKRAERRAKSLPTNVGNQSTIEKQSETKEIQDESQHGGTRKGAGRPTKFAEKETKGRERREIFDSNLIKKQSEPMEESFKLAFDIFFTEVQNAMLSKWAKTSKTAVQNCISSLDNLIKN